MPSAKLIRRARIRLSKPQTLGLSLGLVVVVVMGFFYVQSHAATTTFRFAAFSDTKAGTAMLAQISPEVVAMSPVFGVYPGDVCDAGPDQSCFDTWKTALNGGGSNNLFDRMFVTRGNHDSDGATFWSGAFDFAGLAAKIGATNFTGDNFTYSFDYGNSHFIGVDAPGGDSVNISQSQVNWVDQDLTAAESRGIVHSFAWWHGPVHPEGGHCCTDDDRFIKIFGQHKSFEAIFSGHEHNIGSTLIDSRWHNSGHPFYEIVSGSAGAEVYACEAGRSDFCMANAGFTMVDVNGNNVTINQYKQGTAAAQHTVNITAAGGTVATPTPSVAATPTTPGGGITTPTPDPSGGAERVMNAYTTAYTYYDNTPPGSAIISNPILHTKAGGSGTFADPITVAVGHTLNTGSDVLDYPAGTKFYIPNLRRYFIVEDTCGDGSTPESGPCHTGYPAGTSTWLDVWIDGASGSEADVQNCASTLTDGNGEVHTIIENPASNYGVVSGPVFENGVCSQMYGNTVVTTGGSTGGTASPTPVPHSTPTPAPVSTPAPTPNPGSTPSPTPVATPAAVTGDINSDGQVNITDLTELLTGWTASLARDDVNGDGRLNVYDLSIILSHWTR